MSATCTGLKFLTCTALLAGLTTVSTTNAAVDPGNYTTDRVSIGQDGSINFPAVDVEQVADLVMADQHEAKAYRYAMFYALAGRDAKGQNLDPNMWPAGAQLDMDWRGLTPENCGTTGMKRNAQEGPMSFWKVRFTCTEQDMDANIGAAGAIIQLDRNLPRHLAADTRILLTDKSGHLIWEMTGEQIAIAPDLVSHQGLRMPGPKIVHTAFVPVKPYDPTRWFDMELRYTGRNFRDFEEFLAQDCAITGMSTCFRGTNQMVDLLDLGGFYNDHPIPYFVRSGSCNIDVICDTVNGNDIREWDAEIACVAAISTGGSGFCSGFMINNHLEDGQPFFMTADHCGINSGNAGSLVAYWNFENSICRAPGSEASGGPGDGSLSQFSTGATFLASSSASDFTLVKFVNPVDEAFEVSYCGWNATPDAPTSMVGIHHPSVDEKRISFDDDAGTFTDYLGEAEVTNGSHVRVTAWEEGTTEGGSSGSPLFNQNHQVIGQLHGGFASCSSITSDWYGSFAISYPYNGDETSSLQAWLDPFFLLTEIDTLGGGGLSIQGPGSTTWIGAIGGPFENEAGGGNAEYTLKNNFDVALAYEIGFDASIALKINGSTSPISGTLNPGSTLNVGVTVDTATANALVAGFYQAGLSFTDQTNMTVVSKQHTIEVGQTNFVLTPDIGFETGGPVGGPFNSTQTYTLTSTRPTDLNIEISADQSWIDINGSPSLTTTLTEANPSLDVEISINRQADILPAGIVAALISFNNLDGDNGDTTREITLDVGRYSYASTDTPTSIVDNTVIVSTINVADFYCIGDVDVEVDITHTWSGDLEVILRSPAGTTVYLRNRTGGDEDNVQATFNEGTFDVDGPGLLSDFNGESSNGDWTLEVGDYAGADQGELNSWKLKIASSGDQCPPSAVDVASGGELNAAQTITLAGASGTGGPIDHVIESLPSNGVLSDGGSNIATVPYTLNGATVTYTPDNNYSGADSFTYYVMENSTNSNSAVVSIQVGVPPVLLVDDDDNNPDVRDYYTNALDAMGVAYDIYDTVNSDNEPTAGQLASYDLVLWFTGAEFGGFAGPGTDGETALSSYLDGGGCLFVSSQDWLWDKGGADNATPTPLMANYMKMSSGQSDVGHTTFSGANATFNGLTLPMDFLYTNYTDNISTTAGELAFTGDSGDGAIQYTNETYGAWYLGFGLENVPSIDARVDVLNAVFGLCADDPEPEDCDGDFNGDSQVDLTDFSSFLVAFGNPCSDCPEDMDGNGSVGLEDFSAFLVVFGTSCP
jgi:subtilisin-like proprotein convertase family protein